MRKYAFLVVAALAVLALPSSASAQDTNCALGPAYLDETRYDFDDGDEPDSSAGACVDLDGTPIEGNNFDGGSIEAGTSSDEGINPVTQTENGLGVYLIIDGDDENQSVVLDEGGGYIGLSNYETETDATESGREHDCANDAPDPDLDDNGEGTNSGGCLTFRTDPDDASTAFLSLPVPFIVGGDESQGWDDSTRDGWTVP